MKTQSFSVSTFLQSSFLSALACFFTFLPVASNAEWDSNDSDRLEAIKDDVSLIVPAVEAIRTSSASISASADQTYLSLSDIQTLLHDQLGVYRGSSSSQSTIRYMVWEMMKSQRNTESNLFNSWRSISASPNVVRSLPAVYRYQPNSFLGRIDYANTNLLPLINSSVTNLAVYFMGSSDMKTAPFFTTAKRSASDSSVPSRSDLRQQSLAYFLSMTLGGLYEAPPANSSVSWEEQFLPSGVIQGLSSSTSSARSFFTYWLAEAQRRQLNVQTNLYSLLYSNYATNGALEFLVAETNQIHEAQVENELAIGSFMETNSIIATLVSNNVPDDAREPYLSFDAPGLESRVTDLIPYVSLENTGRVIPVGRVNTLSRIAEVCGFELPNTRSSSLSFPYYEPPESVSNLASSMGATMDYVYGFICCLLQLTLAIRYIRQSHSIAANAPITIPNGSL